MRLDHQDSCSRALVLGTAFLLTACSSTAGTMTPDAAAGDARLAAVDGSDTADGAGDAATDAADDGASEAAADETVDAAKEIGESADGDSDASCPTDWLMAPAVDPSIAVPADGGVPLVHASATGTQNYACAALADGGFGWALVTPQAELRDCRGSVIGHHFASDGGPTAPEWLFDDGSYVIGQRIAQSVPDAGGTSIPWLLLRAVRESDAGVLDRTTFVQRVDTDGGIAPPASQCDPDGGAQMVPYSADYYFFGQ
jgi:hypothetical protein